MRPSPGRRCRGVARFAQIVLGRCHVRSTRTQAVTRLRRPMTARATARRLVLQAALVVPCAASLCLLSPACYPGGAEGTDPPTTTFYFPVGLAVSPGGNVLYVANSDFDLQWNGGTIQSYDLFRLRHDAAELIGANFLTQSPTNANDLVASNGQTFLKAAVTKRLNSDIAFLG